MELLGTSGEESHPVTGRSSRQETARELTCMFQAADEPHLGWALASTWPFLLGWPFLLKEANKMGGMGESFDSGQKQGLRDKEHKDQSCPDYVGITRNPNG